jgi:hypothetical protein
LVSIEDLKVKTAQAGFQRQKTPDEFDNSGLKLLPIEAEEPVFSSESAPAGLGFLWIEVAETAKNLITEAPRNDLVPKSLFFRLDELDQWVRFRLVSQRERLCGVPDQEVRKHEAGAFVGELLERRAGIVAELLFLLLGQSLVVQA